MMRRAFAMCALVFVASVMRADDAGIAKALRSLALVQRIASSNQVSSEAVLDGWGNAIRIEHANGSDRIVASGADGVFEENPAAGQFRDVNGDIVFANGRFVRSNRVWLASQVKTADERAALEELQRAEMELMTRRGVVIAQPVDAAIDDVRYVALNAATESPKTTKRIEPPFPPSYRRAKIGGAVIVEIAIDERGVVEDVRLLKSIAPELDQSAVDTVRQWTFAPTLRDGKPVAVTYRMPVWYGVK